MEIVYLINPSSIKDITNISDNLSDKYIRSALRESQDIGLNQVLGTRLLDKLYTLVSTGRIKDAENAKYKRLLDNHIGYYLAYETITNVVVIASVKIDNAGAVTSDAEKTNSLDLKDVFKIENYYRQKSDFYKARLQAYLRMEHDNFPELEYEDAYNTLAEIETAYTSSIFLGGKRGKKPYRPCYCPNKDSKPKNTKTIRYYVDNVLFSTQVYEVGQNIKWLEAPEKPNQSFNVWIYEKDGQWVNLPDYMPAHDIDCYAHYIWIDGEQQSYTVRYRIAEGTENTWVDFGNMCYINEPFEWLQVTDKGYDDNTREGWATLTHGSLRFDTAISVQRFVGIEHIEMLDLRELNNVTMTDRMFFDNRNLQEFYPPYGLVGTHGYDFYNSSLRQIDFETRDGYTDYQSFAAPMTGSFCFCSNLESIQATNQPFMYSDNGNLYNSSDELMAARYGEVTIKDGTTCIKGEAVKGRGLTTLTIPSSVRLIEAYAVAENNVLTDVYFGGTVEEWGRVEKGENIFQYCQVNVIHCTDGDCDVYYNGEEVAEHKIDIFIEWDYLETRWFRIGERIELPEPPQRDGYVFVSWNAIVPGADWFEMPSTMPNFDFEVHASYSEVQPDEPERGLYRVDFYADTEWLEGKDYFEGDEIAYPVPPTFEGYEFVRWEVNNGGNWEPAPTHMPNYSFNAVAKYDAVQPEYHNVNYYVDGDLVDYQSYQEGENIEAPTAEKEGHTFLGWEGLPIVMPAHDIEVHAIFEINSYKITYVAGDWSDETTYEYGDTINERTAPVKDGYSFLHWDELPATMPAKDITVTAIYERNEYKITYMIDGVPYSEARYYFEDEVQPYVPKVDEGYVFNGWDNEPTVMPAHDVVVTGSMTKVEPSEKPYDEQYFTIEALESGTFTVSGSSTTFQMSTDNGSTWNTATSVELNEGEKVLVKSTVTKGKILGGISSTGNFNAYGNTMSLVYGDDFKGKTDLNGYTWVFNNFFKNCLKLIDASNLILPATTLADYCYQGMFNNCKALVVAPELPALTMKIQCYQEMFFSCESLQAPPQLPATTLASACYSGMFRWCNFTDISDFELPATTLAYGCYSDMFKQCKKLVNAGLTMPALNLADYCYRGMFDNSVLLTTAPELPATTLANYCYASMFNSCSKLKQIIMLATDISASNCLNNWLKSVASIGIFYKSPDMPTETIQTYVPSSWTILDYAG